MTLFAAGSCTVFEDRQDCPCWLSFIMGGFEHNIDTLHVAGWRNGTLFFDSHSEPQQGFLFEKEVSRGDVRVCAFSGIKDGIRDGYNLMIQEGKQADSLFLHSSDINCTDEFATDSITLHKQWVTVKVRLNVETKGYDIIADDCALEVRGDVQGMDLLNLVPLHGDFRFVPQADETGLFTFRLPRYEGNEEELYMDIYKDDVLVDAMPLLDMFSINDFDWTEPSLADVDMTVNLVTQDVVIEVLPWENLGHDNIIF